MDSIACASNASAARAFAYFCTGLREQPLHPAAVERAKHFFIDYMGIALHASTLDSSHPVQALAASRPIPGGANIIAQPAIHYTREVLMSDCIAVINAGSSSVKCGIYAPGEVIALYRGSKAFGTAPRLRILNAKEEAIVDRTWSADGFEHESATR
jgi:hypothetical protein